MDRSIASVIGALMGTNRIGGGLALEARETSALDLERELAAAGAHDASVDEDVDVIGLDVLEQALVVRDDEERPLRPAQAVHAVGEQAQRIDVEARIRLVEDGEARFEHRHLQNLVALL